MSAEDGASIYYTINGNNPTTSSTLYTAPFTLNSSATVKAIAVKDGVSSTVTSATFNVVAGVPTIAAALNTTGQFIFAGNAFVVYQNGNYLYIKDGTGWGLVYGTVDGTYNNGDILNPGWKASKTVYSGLPEFNQPVANTFRSTSSGAAVEPVTLTTIDENTELNMYAFMSNLKVTSVSTDGKTINLDGVSFVLRKQFDVSDLPPFEVGKTYNVRGFVGVYNGTYQLYPIWAEEVVSSDPTITLDPPSLTIDDSGTNNSFTVTARNLHENDYGNVSVAHNWVFNTTLTSSTNTIANWNGLQGFNRNYRSVDGTVTVNYEGRELTATDTYTIGTEGASKTITVTYEPNLYIYCDNGVSPWNFQANPAIAMTNNGEGIYTATLSDIPANSHILFGRASGLTYTWDGDDNRLFMGAVMDNGADWQYGFNEQPGSIDTNPTNPVKYRPIWFPEGGSYTVTINANTRTFTITKEVVLTGDFTLVTDASQLAAGNEVIIVNKGVAANDARTLGQRNDNNYYGTGVIVSNTKTVTATDDTQIFTLENGTGGWYFKTSDNLYLTSYHTGNSNYLQTKAKDGNGENTSLATIAINEDDSNAEIHFQGAGTRKYLRYNVNNGSANDIFSCYQYSTSQANVYLYQRSAAPSISVQPTLDLVIPAGETSANATVTVTETNVTGATTISSIVGDASNFNVTLSGTSLTVTYNGTATEDSPEEITINLVNGEATASITVTGYKVPLTVTFSPVDGATFSESSMNGTITANNADATIYYKTNEMSAFEVYSGSFTVTNSETENPWVQAYAVCGDETSATATATYHHVNKSETIFIRVTSTDQLVPGNKYIIVYEDGPEALYKYDGKGYAVEVEWDDNDIDIHGTSTTIFTLGVTGGSYTLSCDDLYLGHNGKSTQFYEDPYALSILGNDNMGFYVSAVSDSYSLRYNSATDPFRWYAEGSTAGTLARLYVQGVEEQPTPATLAQIEQNSNQGDPVAVSDELIGAWAYGNKLWAKDQGNASIDKRMAATDQMDYLKQEIWHDQAGNEYHLQTGDWDESNWVVLDFSGLGGENPAAACVGKKLTDVKGIYSDANNFTITLTDPVTATADDDAAALYPGYQQNGAMHINPYAWGYNSYIPANFYESNWNGVDAINSNTYVDNQNNDAEISLYFMNPKVQEVARIWGVWNGNGGFAVYGEGYYNRFGIHGAVNVGGWDYNFNGVVTDLVKDKAYLFHAVVAKPATKLGAVPPTASNDAASSALVIYPLDLSAQGSMTAVKDIVGDRHVKSVSYYNIMGVESAQPFQGVNIIVTRYTDGSTSTAKVMF